VTEIADAVRQLCLEMPQADGFSAEPCQPPPRPRIESERELAGIALALVASTELTRDEQHLAVSALRAKGGKVDAVLASLAAGHDPLGDAFSEIRSPSARRITGAVYTPPPIVAAMTSWAASQCDPVRVIDPGAGSGRFLLTAAARFPTAALIGIETDPLAALILRANLCAAGLAARGQVIVADYRSVKLPKVNGTSLFIGNPPYVRHHELGTAWKTWFAQSAARAGIKASKLAGLHVHFFFKTMELARKGDTGIFITSAEWLDVNYGSALRQLLAGKLGGSALHILDPACMPFAGTATTGAITCFHPGQRPASISVKSVTTLAELDGLPHGRAVPWETVARSQRWTNILRPAVQKPAGYSELGELFRVSRGQVTGNNAIWIEGIHTAGLPPSRLFPTVTKARELISAGDALSDASLLRRVLSLPVDLDELEPAFRKAAARFIRWAKAQGAADGYIARHRRAWWSVPLYDPAPIVCTYMARRPPAFVRNLCQARLLNIAHGLYPRQPLDPETISGLLFYLRRNVGTASGRTYAGGLTKFESRELERILIPGLETLRHAATANLD
jgi:hypothetical protein